MRASTKCGYRYVIQRLLLVILVFVGVRVLGLCVFGGDCYGWLANVSDERRLGKFSDGPVLTGSESGSTPSRNSKYFMTHQVLVQKKRKRAVDFICDAHPELGNVSILKMNVFQADKTRIVYCSVPKAGCSNWKRVLAVLEDRANSTVITDVHHRNYTTRVASLSDHSLKRLQEEYISFITVRHPFVRLLSAYINKIASYRTPEKVLSSDVFVNYARHIAQKYRKGAHTVDYKTATNLNLTWQEWVTYLTDPSERARFNEHWKEYYKLCSPCRIKYDYILNLETVEDDSLYLLTSLGYNNKVRYPLPPYGSPRSSDALYEEHFTQLSKEDIQKLYDVYKYDFELFGYPKPRILL